jgi:GNAT superfamily N-acetyltransferase
VIIEALAKHHDRSAFSCGTPALDIYIKQMAWQDLERRTASVFVAANESKVVGFYSLSATAISHQSLPSEILKKLPKYPIPAVLLGRLAVDEAYQGKNIGKILLVNAMKRALSASGVVGMYALVVDAKNEQAREFYQHFGFISLVDFPMRLFLPMDTIASCY